MKRDLFRKILILFLAALSLSSCKKYFNPEPRFEDYDQGPDRTVKRKVLMISIDGLVGHELKTKIPINIATLMKNGKYSFDAISDKNTSDVASWATMMTGYSSSVHRIVEESYLPTPPLNDPHGTIDFSPSIVFRIKEINPALKTAVVVQDAGIGNILLVDADVNVLALDDEEARDETVKLLEKKASPDLLVVQFKDVLLAGKGSAFSAAESEYAAAIEQVDTKIGDILKALDARANKEFENWLVIITASHGGLAKSYGGESFFERNIFTLYYQRDLKELELIPDVFVSPRFYGYDGSESGPKEGVRARNIIASAEEERYNIAQTGELTIEAKIKINKNGAGNWDYSSPPFLSKIEARYGSIAGWCFYRSANNVVFWCADGSTSMSVSANSVSVNDEWAHITAKVIAVGTSVKITIYVNGDKLAEETQRLNINALLSSSPLTFGFQGTVFAGGFIDMFMADVHIWDRALSDAEIKENAIRIGIDGSHPKYINLIGFWPLDDGDGLLRNKINGMPNIPLQGKYEYRVTPNNLPFADKESIVSVENLDLAPQIFYWLELDIRESWAWQGDGFLTDFEVEFLK